MKHKIFAANWKLYKTPAETRKFFSEFLIPGGESEIFFFPTALCLESALQCTAGTQLQVGPQNISHQKEGAFTGENSAQTAMQMGCRAVLIGHSERRSLYFETDEMIQQKVQLAQSLGLKVVLCVGETLQERESGRTNAVLEVQLQKALKGAKAENLIVAYEPVWAIGTGKTATPQMANETQTYIQSWLNQNQFLGAPILYGGSVRPENAKELLAEPAIAGFLVGGASLNPESFARICQA
jgi:triosephosphate isomerase (TIM)